MTDVCSRAGQLAQGWTITPQLALLVAQLEQLVRQEIGRDLEVISGYRTVEEQIALARAGRPAADPDLSNHTRCPATAVDVRIGALPTNAQKARLGALAQGLGLRWGGGSPVDPQTGIPSDWNHFDLGPRHAG